MEVMLRLQKTEAQLRRGRMTEGLCDDDGTPKLLSLQMVQSRLSELRFASFDFNIPARLKIRQVEQNFAPILEGIGTTTFFKGLNFLSGRILFEPSRAEPGVH